MINSFMKECRFLSNFYPATVKYNGLVYKNSEAAYQAQKCTNEKDREQFCELSPMEAKMLGQKITIRKDWENIRVSEMRNIIENKFSQNEDLKKMLLETSEEYLEEGNDWGDKFWGTVNGKGLNMLGKILMDTRKKLFKENDDERRNNNRTFS